MHAGTQEPGMKLRLQRMVPQQEANQALEKNLFGECGKHGVQGCVGGKCAPSHMERGDFIANGAQRPHFFALIESRYNVCYAKKKYWCFWERKNI